jgi:hypothetical protein
MDHYDALRAHPLFRDSTICYVLENNLGHEHDHISYLVRNNNRISNATVLYENAEVAGFRTSAASKLRADDRLQEMITMEGVGFLSNFISVNPDPNKSGANARKELIAQIGNMRCYTNQLPNGESRRVITSLFDETFRRISGRHDDMQRALSMLLIVSNLFLTRRLPVNYTLIDALRGNRNVQALPMSTIDGTRKRGFSDH